MTRTPTPDADPRYTVVYDGACGLCRRAAARLRAWDRRDRLRLVPFQEPGVLDRYPQIEEREFREAVQTIAPDGRYWSGADAVEQALRQAGQRRLARLFALPFARLIARAVYRWVARNRSWLGRFF